jgi:uncharacterized membrane-anchored protein
MRLSIISYLLISIVFYFNNASGQIVASVDTTKKFDIAIEISGGYSYKLTKIVTSRNYKQGGLSGIIRVKYNSDNLFAIGVESGWLPLSSSSQKNVILEDAGMTDISASLNAIPFFFLITFQKFGIQIYTGIGLYNVKSTNTVFNKTIYNNQWDTGYSFGGGYALSFTRKIYLGSEIKWNRITQLQTSVASIHFRFIYILF